MEPQKTMNRQITFEQEGQSLRYHITSVEIILQSPSDQNNNLLA